MPLQKLKESMKSKTWYVTMQQKEIEAFSNPFERLVYEGIKSFCGNGKTEGEASNFDIATRANVSKMTVGRYLPILIDKGFVKIVGKATRVGGTVNIFLVFPEVVASVTSRDSSLEKSVSLRYESVTISGESVTDTGTKPSNIKSKNEEKKTQTFSYKNSEQNNTAAFSPDLKEDLFDYAEAISIKGGVK